MKFNIYIKILTAFLVIFLIFVLAFFKYLKSFETEIVINAGKTTSRGLLISLENELINNPKSNWDAIIKKKTDNVIHLKAVDSLKLTSTQKNQLNNGEIIFLSGRTYQFLNLVIVEHTAYKKIGNTSYALAYYFSDPGQVIFHYMNPTLKQIVEHLLLKPKNTWNKELLKLAEIYGFPLHVYKTRSQHLPSDVINSLSTKRLVFETNKNSSQIVILYYSFSGGILKIGPLSYLPVMARISDVMYYFIGTFFFISLCLIALFSLLFVRNMKKVYQITKNFSQGNFDFHRKIGTTSVLYGLYRNIIQMGEQLKELIESHKQLCRFVAHEIRTPLSTIQMATDSIKRKNAEDALLNKQINSIQEDIADMNRLVSTFLIYSKMHSNELKLKQSETDIIVWLRKLLESYSSSTFEITFHSNELNSLKAYIDENILKHAVTNLITNAMKFAEHTISLTISLDNSHILLHVDDDGPGLPDDGADDIFSEYTIAEDAGIGDKHIGLGLAIVKKVVNLHGGKVMATQSPILKGARFTIVLPIYS
ncbi:ATP-binding protein [Legionella pneumophila serogroup 1]|uniref:sensor histidine kinase n=1 Tax=Legionella pneumophila TaxID=446 RepID=UPI000770B0D0|nr:ATP-binding protein [Legionella pneumophila]HAT8862532.1 sensor histidine kinase [Legionella pneumophila subsp. pneumophila]MDI9825874.1 ATP-binding protein [Legionella pneumophila]MDW8897002.1 ATP-binding protein [Legionella pneumophila]CZH49022.1 Sensor protein RstB [Legionella pneumophila]CZI54523.1 Sensor protein RstB [Legionella pneumophila]